MNTPAISVENLSKVYRIGRREESTQTLAGAMSGFLMSPLHNLRRLRALSRFRPDELEASGDVVWALKDVSFTVERGQVLGIIGSNGAGKSTLLKILSRITAPSSGRVVLDGRVSSLLEVGTGFHPELTGRENVFLNGTILGMTTTEINKRYDEIVSFSGVEKFIETPVKYYSSGMRVRLAFSVAAHLEPEILMVDEVLAVGDVDFQKKCIGKMGEVSRAGRTVLFVSHNMAAVSSLCDRGIWIEAGRVHCEGDADKVIAEYLSVSSQVSTLKLVDRTDREGAGPVKFTDLEIYGSGSPGIRTEVQSGRPMDVVLHFEVDGPVQGPLDGPMDIAKADFTVVVNDVYQTPLFACATHLHENITALPRTGSIRFHIPRLPLSAGEYKLRVHCGVNDELSDLIVEAGSITVHSGDYFGAGKLPRPERHGVFLVDYNWVIETENHV